MKKKGTALTVTKQVVVGDLTFMRIGDGPIRVKGEGDISVDEFHRIAEALDAETALAPLWAPTYVSVPCHHQCDHWWHKPYTWTVNSGTSTSTSGTLMTYTLADTYVLDNTYVFDDTIEATS
jgi:hypothetical protein